MLAHVDICEVTGWLRSTVHGEVLRCGDSEVVLGVIALQARDVRHAHAAGKEWVLAVRLLPAAPSRIAEDVEVGRPEVEAAHDTGVSFALVLHVLDTAFNADLPGHRVDARCVEGCGQADRLGILRHTLVDYAMQSLTPPLIRGNLEPRNGGRVVLHLRRFFGQRHAMHQVRGPLLWR